MNIPYVFKKCTKCGEWLVASEVDFRKKKGGKYRLTSQCKKCEAEYNKQRYENNKDKILKQNKQWYEVNKDKILEYHKQYNKQYREDNKDNIAEQRKQYYKDNKGKIAKLNKQYRDTPHGQVATFNSHCKRRIREQNQGSGIIKEQWLECMKFFGFRCAYSGQVLSKDTRSLDHIKPLNQGGEHEIWNLIPMYKPYNSSKKDKELLEWYKEQPFYSEERLQKIYEWQEYAFNKWGRNE